MAHKQSVGSSEYVLGLSGKLGSNVEFTYTWNCCTFGV